MSRKTVSKETYLHVEKGDHVRVWESVGRLLRLEHGFHIEKEDAR